MYVESRSWLVLLQLGPVFIAICRRVEPHAAGFEGAHARHLAGGVRPVHRPSRCCAGSHLCRRCHRCTGRAASRPVATLHAL
eukprot:1603571-Prymnesium_polylepis.1